jgi:hypothetical protein
MQLSKASFFAIVNCHFLAGKLKHVQFFSQSDNQVSGRYHKKAIKTSPAKRQLRGPRDQKVNKSLKNIKKSEVCNCQRLPEKCQSNKLQV